MPDPIELPSSVPLNSLRTLLQFAKGDHQLDACVAAAGLTVLGYAAGLFLPAHDGGAKSAEPSQPAANVIEALEAAIASAEPQPAAALNVDWRKIAEFVITIVVKAIL